MFDVKSAFLKSAIPDHSHVFHLFILYLLKTNASQGCYSSHFSVEKNNKTKQNSIGMTHFDINCQRRQLMSDGCTV